MKVLVTGAGGMLAHALVPELRRRDHAVIALTREELDVTDRRAVERAVTREAPEAVVQCAAYTDVDGAEGDFERALEVNATATGHLAEVCHTLQASFVYPSTDYVFDGGSTRPYLPDDAPRPMNAYGRSKLAGEQAAGRAERHLVVRTSWLYGAGGANFVETMLRVAAERERVEVVGDQIGRPTWTRNLAGAITRLLEKDAQGVLHVTDSGPPTSWYGFAKEILGSIGAAEKVREIASAQFVRPAARPTYSVLDLKEAERLLGFPPPDWRESLKRYMCEREGENV